MKTTIIKGSIDYLDDCEQALVNSKLGRIYFNKSESARKALEKGFSEDKIYVALGDDKSCIGFIWFTLHGAFHSFPYLHIIAVKEQYRNKGIGTKLLKFFEDRCFENYSKVFLVVADFNPDAKRLYESMGYAEVGCIPDLYKAGITEHLMMKLKAD